MASHDKISSSKDSLPDSDINGRIFLVEGKQFPVGEEVLNKMIEWSEFFRALLTSDFKEQNQQEIELKEVAAEDFDNFLTLVRIVLYYNGKHESKNKEQLVKWIISFNKCNIGSLILLADRFMAPKAINVVSSWLKRICLQSVDLIQILEVAFQINNEYLKMLSIYLMIKVSKDLKPVDSGPMDMNTIGPFLIKLADVIIYNTTFFYNNEDRFNALPLQIRKYICEKNPNVKGLVKED